MPHIKRSAALAAAVLASIAFSGCAADKNLAMSCTEYIGKPVAHLVAYQGKPTYTVEIDKTRIGLVYTATAKTYTPSYPYYEVNYMVGVENKRSVSRPVRVSCSATYIVLKRPGEKQFVIDVWPVR